MMEHDAEPVRGLPANLPRGEDILWQGEPDWRALAAGAFHTHAVAVYFGLLAIWSFAGRVAEGATALDAAVGSLPLLACGVAAVAILSLLAWLVGRTTVYTITTRRVVLRFGIALPITINVPFRIVASAALERRSQGTGNIALTLRGDDRVSYLVLWPHARPWRAARAEPMLRFVPDAERVAGLLAQAAAAATDTPLQQQRANAAEQGAAANGVPWTGASATA